MNSCKNFSKVLGRLKEFRRALDGKENVAEKLVLAQRAQELINEIHEKFMIAFADILEKKLGVDMISSFNYKGLAVASNYKPEKSNMKQLVNFHGKVLIEADEVRLSENDGGYIVRDESQKYYVDGKGVRVNDESYAFVTDFIEGYSVVGGESKYYFLGENYKPAFGEMNWSSAKPFNDGVATVSDKGVYSLIGMDGELILTGFKSAGVYSEGLVTVQYPGDKSGVKRIIDIKGDEKFVLGEDDNNCETVRRFSEGYAAVTFVRGSANMRVCRYVDKEGNFMDGEYELARDFKYGVAKVRENGKWYYIDKTGEKIMGGREFKEDDNFGYGGLMRVEVGGEIRPMDTEGNILDKEQVAKKLGFKDVDFDREIDELLGKYELGEA